MRSVVKMGLNDFIQKLVSNPPICQHAEVGSFLKIDENQNEELEENHLYLANPRSSLAEETQIKPSDFDYLKIIGKGSFGKVLLAKHKENEQYYAVKVLQKKIILKKKEQKHIMAERSVLMKNIKHPFLVGLHYSFQTTDKLYFVLDYVNGGELFYHLQRERVFLEPRARFYAAEIASALGYLHSLHIVYRVVMTELHLKLIYFKLTKLQLHYYKCTGPTDLRHFDPEFTHLPVSTSLCNTDNLHVTSSVREAAGAFPGFSYGPPADHAFQ
uniref:Serine/threonine-protein kinase Sgk1-like n=1 Tax=Sinocyclocheilus grahami TaxID=75366 RepID=A0A672K8M7_SINGR